MLNGTEIHQPRLKNIHEVLGEARFEEQPETKEVYTYRAEDVLVEKASAICKQNGSTTSGFLRQCLVQLVEDYS